jgi:hypothetical protein
MNDIEKDIADRKAKFLKSYSKLREEFQMDFASFPMYIPNERGMFDTVMNTQPVDLKYRPKEPIKSPLVM